MIPSNNKPDDVDTSEEFEPYSDNDEEAKVVNDIEDAVDSTGHLINQQPAYDLMLNAEVLVHLNDNEPVVGKVARRALDHLNKTAGEYNDNPHINTMVYEVEFPDGMVKEYAANVIAENILRQVDHDGFSTAMLKSIIDHKWNDDAVSSNDGYIISKEGRKQPWKTTKGWKLLVQWSDNSKSWVPLKDLKESNPVEVAEFARARGIATEPAFAWWVPYTLRKRDVILSSIKALV